MAKKAISAPRCRESAAIVRSFSATARTGGPVLCSDLGDRPGHGEDDVELLGGQWVRPSPFEAFGVGERLTGGTSGGCGRSCTRRGDGHSGRTARRVGRGLRCGSTRSQQQPPALGELLLAIAIGETLLCEGPGGFQALAEQRRAEAHDARQPAPICPDVSVVVGRFRVYREAVGPIRAPPGSIASGILASVRRGFVHGHPILAGASCVTRFAVDSS